MIIKIHTEDQSKFLLGKALTFEKVQFTVDAIFKKNINDFAEAFCATAGYREMPYSEGYADFIIDLGKQIVFVSKCTFPKELCGAKVLYFTESGTFEPLYHAGGEVAEQVYYLAICKADNENSHSVFYINEKLKVVADGCIEDYKCFMDAFDAVWYQHKNER